MEGIKRLFKVLFSPGEVFEEAKKTPKLLLPIIFLTLVTTGTMSYYTYQMNAPIVIEKQLELSGKADRFSGEMKDKIVATQTKMMKFGIPISAFFGTPIMFFLIALYFFVMAKLMGSEATYVQSLAVSVYASAPAIIAMFVAAAIMLTGDTSTTMFQNLIPSNLGYFFPMEQVGRKLYVLLKAVDFFAIWKYILMIIGFQVITGTKIWKSALVILVPIVLFVSVTALIF